MLLDEAMAAEQLYGVAADAHALVRHQSPRQCRFTNETDPAFGTARGAIRQQAHAFKFDTAVGDRDCDRLAMAVRLAERHALVYVVTQIYARTEDSRVGKTG